MTLARIGMRSSGSRRSRRSSWAACRWGAGWALLVARAFEPAAQRRSSAAVAFDPEHVLRLHRIVSAVAPRVAPEQAPPRENQALKYAVLPDRLDRVARARRLVLAAPRDR